MDVHPTKNGIYRYWPIPSHTHIEIIEWFCSILSRKLPISLTQHGRHWNPPSGQSWGRPGHCGNFGGCQMDSNGGFTGIAQELWLSQWEKSGTLRGKIWKNDTKSMKCWGTMASFIFRPSQMCVSAVVKPWNTTAGFGCSKIQLHLLGCPTTYRKYRRRHFRPCVGKSS